jgi:cation diffusion facilitator family transporter
MKDAKIRLLIITLAISTGLMGIKFLGYKCTNSDAILTDAIESIVNVLAGGFALFSLYQAYKPKDMNHPYGHGKIEFLSAGVEGLLIFVAGFGMVGKAVYSFFSPPLLQQIDIGVGLTALSTFINWTMGEYLIGQGKKHKLLTLIADGKHIRSDAYSSVGLLLGLLIIYFTHWFWFDTLLTLFFACLIIYTGYGLMREASAGVLDEANEDIMGKILVLLKKHRQDAWIDVHNLRVIQYGRDLHIDCHATLPYYWDLNKVHDEVRTLEQVMEKVQPYPVEVFIHADPCLPPASCAVCQIQHCKLRQQSPQQKLEWTLDNIRKNQKHNI